MQSGKPPPESRSDPLGTAELNAARGTLREALSALRNFAELLHSVRVGSKALVSVLPDVAAGCAPMRATVDSLLAAVATRAGTSAATAELSAYFTPRLALLDRELGAAGDRPLSARTRLSLEQVITRLSLELDTARGLLDLLVDAVSNQSVRVDLAELVQQSFAGPPSGGSWNREHIVATMSFVQAEIEVELNPRIATALFALGVEWVAQRAEGTPHLLVDQDSTGRYRVQIAPGARGGGDDLILIARGVIDPTFTCLRAVAGISGVALLWDETSSSLCFLFPEPAKTQRKADEAG
ncbi:MAG TPA: hypothetical protein VNW92_21650 [Polyangiaceae bacterium]|nr:hypothetical protein [Polyangiaceae bacterium]